MVNLEKCLEHLRFYWKKKSKVLVFKPQKLLKYNGFYVICAYIYVKKKMPKVHSNNKNMGFNCTNQFIPS